MSTKKIKNFFFYEDTENLSFKERFKKFITNPKEVIKFFLPIILMCSLLIPVPYYIVTGGGTISLEEKIKVEGGKESSGSFNSAYVSQVNGNVFSYLLSYVMPNYEKERIADIVETPEETAEDYSFRERMYFKNSLSTATKLAFTYANEAIDIKEKNYYIVYKCPEANTTLKYGDMIKKIENTKINNLEEINNLINKYSYKDEINITVVRDNKEINTISKYIDVEGEKKLCISVMEDIIYNTDKKITYNFSNKEEGPSGGLMLTLSIYNQLIDEDITKGRKIVGTGTISSDGTVGEIGGVKYKLLGAEKAKADIFLVPYENYEEAIRIKKEKNYKIDIIKVHTFEEALEKLK